LGYAGRSVLRSQCSVRRHCPAKARTGSERDDRRLHANPHSHHEQLALPRRRSQLRCLDRPPSRNRHRPVNAVRKFRDLAPHRVSGDSRETMGQPIYPESQRFRCRQESGQATEVGWARGVALPHRHREPPGDAPIHVTVARGRLVTIPLDDQPHRCLGHPQLRAVRARLVHLLHSRCDALPQLPLPDTVFHSHPDLHQIPCT